MENNNQIWEQKDKRISFLSILHSLAILHQGQNLDDKKLADFATQLNDELYMKYPFPIDTSFLDNKRNSGAINAPGSVKICPVPDCGSPMIRQLNKKNPKGPDWKCSNKSCKFQKMIGGGWVKSQFITGVWDDKPENIDRAKAEDQILDEATHFEHFENEHPNNRIPEEYL